MGGQQSKQPSAAAAAQEKLLVERLRDIDFGDEEDYVEVGDVSEKAVYQRARHEPEGLPLSVLEVWLDNVLKDPKNKLALSTLSGTDPLAALTSPSVKIADPQVFNVKIPFEGGPITNQRSSGRCWLFAATNIFRVALMKRHGLESFELSQSYLFYWDKLEKANWFLEQIIDTAGEDLDRRDIQWMMGDLVSDGGQWDMVYNLVEKYGLVPQALYPDSWNAMNSRRLNGIIKTKLREYALKLRKLMRQSHVPPAMIAGTKARALQEVALIMTLLLGPPPKPNAAFTWQYVDKNDKYHEIRSTPKEFAKNIYTSDLGVNSAVIDGMISLVHDPRNDFMRGLTVSRLGNVVGGRGVNYVNVDIGLLKSTCVKMLKAGYPVFFGCDVGKFSDSTSGVMDLDLFNYEAGINTSLLGMNKAERLTTGESKMTHAMVLTAVHVDERTGKSIRWRVQNSWGADSGDKGWFVMSDAWMDEFVYQAVVDGRFVSKEVRDVLKSDPIVLPVWDPMGSLA